MSEQEKKSEGEGTEVGTLWMPMGSILLPAKPNDPVLKIVMDWLPQGMEAINEAIADINKRICDGVAFFNDQGETHFIQHPLTSAMVDALSETVTRELKDHLWAMPRKSGELESLLGE